MELLNPPHLYHNSPPHPHTHPTQLPAPPPSTDVTWEASTETTGKFLLDSGANISHVTFPVPGMKPLTYSLLITITNYQQIQCSHHRILRIRPLSNNRALQTYAVANNRSSTTSYQYTPYPNDMDSLALPKIKATSWTPHENLITPSAQHPRPAPSIRSSHTSTPVQHPPPVPSQEDYIHANRYNNSPHTTTALIHNTTINIEPHSTLDHHPYHHTQTSCIGHATTFTTEIQLSSPSTTLPISPYNPSRAPPRQPSTSCKAGTNS